MRALIWPVVAVFSVLGLGAIGPQDAWRKIPYGLPIAPESLARAQQDPRTAARHALGERLFFARELSLDHSLSCASCHQPERGFASADATSPGVGQARTLRNAPSLINRGFGKHFMWDGSVSSLEEQVLLPISNELEMALPLEQALERLRGDSAWKKAFAAEFEDGVTQGNLALALATFVRFVWLGDSPVDRFRQGDYEALTELERIGLWTFEGRGRCWQCHSGGNFTDEDFHNTGVGAHEGIAQEGRLAATGNPADRGKFKTPSLRGVALSAPFMHDGSQATLGDVVEFYRQGGRPNANLDELLAPIELSEREATGLVHFLQALARPASEASATADRKGQ